MRRLTTVLLFSAALIATACDRDATAPPSSPSADRTSLSPEQEQLAEQIRDLIRRLFGGNDSIEAQARFTAIEALWIGGYEEEARTAAAGLVAFTLEKLEAGELRDPDRTGPLTPTTGALRLNNNVFTFVEQPENVVTESGTGDGDAVVVFVNANEEETVEIADASIELTLDADALVSMSEVAGGELTFPSEFETFPPAILIEISSATGAKLVGTANLNICAEHGANRLAQSDDGVTSTVLDVGVVTKVCGTVGASSSLEWDGSIGGGLRSLGRFASRAAGVFLPRTAHAGHAATSGSVKTCCSTFVGVQVVPGWQESSLSGIVDKAHPDYVLLPPAGDGDRALPTPVDGPTALWYGDMDAGNYMFGQAEGDNLNSGGTSVAAHSGTFVSPELTIPAPGEGEDVRLVFETWFEIESINPSSFDRMIIAIEDVAAPGVLETLGMLNPVTDPGGSSNVPYTSAGLGAAESSAGLNVPAEWRTVTEDVGAYAGKSVRLHFTFETIDPLYNGFRGWIVDGVRFETVSAPVITSLNAFPDGGSSTLMLRPVPSTPAARTAP